MNQEYSEKKRGKFLYVLLCVLILFVAIVGISYAFLNITKTSQANSISTGSVSMSYTESNNGIFLENAFPVKDEIGMNMLVDGTYFDFTVTGSSSANLNVPYEINVFEKELSGNISEKNIKVYLTKIVNGYEQVIVGPMLLEEFEKSDYRNGAIKIYSKNNYFDKIDSTTDKYRLRMWISYESDANLIGNSLFSVTVNVDASAIIK